MAGVVLECVACGSAVEGPEDVVTCPRCGDGVQVVVNTSGLRYRNLRARWRARPPGVWRYRELLPPNEDDEVSLSEGGTPLLRIRTDDAEQYGAKTLLKNEGQNPTGSFKDRGMTVGVSRARSLGRRRVICASTGNTAASLAAYAARAGIESIVLVPSGGVARGKLAQAFFEGARVISVRGSFDDAMSMVREAATRLDAYVLNSINPFRIEGQKTAAYEVFEQLGGRVPDWLIAPVGNGGNLAAYAKGFEELRAIGATDRVPRLVGVQAEGASPIADAVLAGRDTIAPVAAPQTVASAIRIGNPANAPKTIRAIRESDGLAAKVPDAAILEAQGTLARSEGIFVEPAGAASVAGAIHLGRAGTFDSKDIVVCVGTGHGLKDPEAALRSYREPVAIEPTVDALVAAVGAGAR